MKHNKKAAALLAAEKLATLAAMTCLTLAVLSVEAVANAQSVGEALARIGMQAVLLLAACVPAGLAMDAHDDRLRATRAKNAQVGKEQKQ